MFRLVLVLIFAVATTIYGKNIKFPSSSVGGRIVGGEKTTIEEYPYQISLEVKGKHHCGGSLIRPNVVLTAAHCTKKSKKKYLVRAGSTIVEEGGQVAEITDICSHPKYDDETDDYDVSVLKLNEPLNLNSAVQVIDLQNVGEEVPVNTMATVTGWGDLEFGGNISEILQKVNVPKVDQKECQDKFSDWGEDTITDRMTCYGYAEGGKDSCQADSGGPLVANGKQIGIVSWGIKCGLPNMPGVYTRLENEEIQEHIDQCLAKFA